MKPITQLNQPLINKIAAGEVVERPLSVVKELMENAIDAGASSITVEISEGGLSSIRVTDNGVGIPADQILLAFARHATSKIASLDDLFEVGTLGFRGEALSSIAAVAQVEMITKTTGQVTGMRVEIHGGELVSQREIGAAGGTTIIVNNLFYNTPARRKFLKKPGTEAGYIADCLQKLALGNPSLTIRYINNGEIAFQTNGKGDLKTAMLNIYGRETASQLISVAANLDEMELAGLIAKPDAARGNRQRQSFFINGRLIQSKLLTQAVEEAARGMLPSGKFPVYALNLSLPHDVVDVNVHPTKMDVRFADEDAIFRFIRGAVREELTESSLIPEVRFSKKDIAPLEQMVLARDETPRHCKERSDEATDETPRHCEERSDEAIQRKSQPSESLGLLRDAQRVYIDGEDASLNIRNNEDDTSPNIRSIKAGDSLNLPRAGMNAPRPASLREESPPAPASPLFTNYNILGIIFGTYWLVTQDESLYLIDQHAAHERVLYEEILEKTAMGHINSQRLVAPITLRLTPRESSLLKENLTLFARFGFEIAQTDENSPAPRAEITAVPALFKGPVTTAFFTDLLDKISETGFLGAGVYAHKADAMAMAACKASVKAGDNITEAEAHGLIKKMLTLENPFTCPHGRPTIIEITKRELTRRFKRS